VIVAAGVFLVAFFSMAGTYFYQTKPVVHVTPKQVVHVVKTKMPKQAQTLNGLAISNLAKK
tara:strand:- start:7132 stop:7314 length:183 start_codon:yes stop_codon:yes gene_type:complete